MNWRLATRYALIGAAIIAGVWIGMLEFLQVSMKLGLAGALVTLLVGLYLVSRVDAWIAMRGHRRPGGRSG